jgi:hypothetical protein
MTDEIRPARKRAPYGFAKWQAPAKFLRTSPQEQRDIPFADDKDYIRADRQDKWVGIVVMIAAVVVLAVSFWEWLQ